MAVLMVVSACSSDEISVILSENGELVVKMIDETSQPVAGERMLLYAVNSSAVLKSGLTDEAGMIDFGTMNVGSYYLETEYKAKANVYYSIGDMVQVVSNNKSTHEIALGANYKEEVQIQVYQNASSDGAADAKVYIVQYNDDTDDILNNLDGKAWSEITSLAIDNGSTNDKGLVIFNVPVGYSYYVFLENTGNDGFDTYNSTSTIRLGNGDVLTVSQLP